MTPVLWIALTGITIVIVGVLAACFSRRGPNAH